MLSGHIDPITFEVLSHRLHQITREMGIALERTGGTVTTTQQHDYNASLYRADGEIMAAGETYGHHVVCAGFAVRRILERFGAEGELSDDGSATWYRLGTRFCITAATGAIDLPADAICPAVRAACSIAATSRSSVYA